MEQEEGTHVVCRKSSFYMKLFVGNDYSGREKPLPAPNSNFFTRPFMRDGALDVD